MGIGRDSFLGCNLLSDKMTEWPYRYTISEAAIFEYGETVNSTSLPDPAIAPEIKMSLQDRISAYKNTSADIHRIGIQDGDSLPHQLVVEATLQLSLRFTELHA